MNPVENPTFQHLRKRLLFWEIFIAFVTLCLFWLIQFMKGSEQAVIVVIMFGTLLLCVVYPRSGFYVLTAVMFTESLVGGLNMVATIANQMEIEGIHPIFESAFFYLTTPGLAFAVILGYVISRYLSNTTPFGMMTTEYIMLVPALLCITFLPLSFILQHPALPVIADCLPGMFFIMGIFIARLFYPVKGAFYIWLNVLCIGNHIIGIGFFIFIVVTSFFTYPVYFVMTAIRTLMGPTDFPIFLVPILLCVIIYCRKDVSRGWMIFYHFSLWAFFLRLIIAMYRGPIAATFLAMAFVYFLSAPDKRALMRIFFLRMLIIIAIVVVLFITVVPYGDVVIQATFVERFTGLFQQGEEHELAKASLAERKWETDTAWNEVKEHPIVGHGPGAELDFRFYSRQDTDRRAYIHDGYLWLWHKFGILGPISIIFFLLAPFIRGWQLRRKELSTTEMAFLIGAMSATVSIFPAIVTNSIIARGQGLLMLITCFSILLNIERRVMKTEGMDIRPYL